MKSNQHRKTTNAWAMYDWANSAFATSILTALLPVYYQTVAGIGLPGNTATVYWGYTTAAALAIAAVLSPVLGAMADFKGAKKRYLGYFALLGVTGTALLYFAGQGQWLLASIFFILGNVGYAGANVFYDSLLPHVAGPEEIDQVSARGFAFGYLGGGLLLAVNVAMIYFAGPEQSAQVIRLAFLTVAVWWLVFSLPLLVTVPEVSPLVMPGEAGKPALQVSLSRLKGTYHELRKYREVLKFLLAIWLYTDGIGTIVKMAVIVGAEIGISQTTLVGTILLVQFVSIPFSVLFGNLAKRTGPKRGIYIGLSVYTLAALGAMRMQADWHFLLLGVVIAFVQGGTQALTRSMGARMIPKSKSGEFFGFVSVTIKFAGIAGPLIFAFTAQYLGNSRLGFLTVLVFFLGGIYFLQQVDEQQGVELAEQEEARLAALGTHQTGQ